MKLKSLSQQGGGVERCGGSLSMGGIIGLAHHILASTTSPHAKRLDNASQPSTPLPDGHLGNYFICQSFPAGRVVSPHSPLRKQAICILMRDIMTYKNVKIALKPSGVFSPQH
ncbi:hypothetical protein DPV78_011876 [Talaromyces pinophilus]|nr:hypothetical protein DPV78_011876 [Talaromyces pinophilus]